MDRYIFSTKVWVTLC